MIFHYCGLVSVCFHQFVLKTAKSHQPEGTQFKPNVCTHEWNDSALPAGA